MLRGTLRLQVLAVLMIMTIEAIRAMDKETISRIIIHKVSSNNTETWTKANRTMIQTNNTINNNNNNNKGMYTKAKISVTWIRTSNRMQVTTRISMTMGNRGTKTKAIIIKDNSNIIKVKINKTTTKPMLTKVKTRET